jgi:hypothetical protein
MTPMTTFTSNGFKRVVEPLDAYFRDNVFGCRHMASCQMSAERKGHCFNAVQLPHVGELYDLSHEGRPFRIAVCGQEAGGAKGDGSIAGRSSRMSKWGRDKSFSERNPHMQGTTSALRLLFGLPLSSETRDDLIIVNGEYRHLFDVFALINALTCSSTAAATGKNGKPTREMKRNCVEHLRATVQILRPTVLVVQGKVAAEMLKQAFPDMQVRPKGGWIPGTDTFVPFLSHPSARPDPRRGDRARLDWADLDSPYLLDEVAPLLSGLSRHLLQQQRAVAQ